MIARSSASRCSSSRPASVAIRIPGGGAASCEIFRELITALEERIDRAMVRLELVHRSSETRLARAKVGEHRGVLDGVVAVQRLAKPLPLLAEPVIASRVGKGLREARHVAAKRVVRGHEQRGHGGRAVVVQEDGRHDSLTFIDTTVDETRDRHGQQTFV